MPPLEWVIDIIKEWVIEQAYATEAWVEAKLYATETWVNTNFFTQTHILESTIPLIVTGDLTPNATGTYFAAGLYQGRLYYRRTDGAYFIWWDGPCLDYNLSTGLGVKAPGFWWGPWKNIEGEYGWADDYDGLPFVSEGYSYLTTSFVDRGDPAAFDFTLNDFTRDSVWRDLNLSAIVPAGAKAVSLFCQISDAAILRHAAFRTKGNANDKNISRAYINVSNIRISNDFVVPLDENRVIQYNSNIGVFQTFDVCVKGWWL